MPDRGLLDRANIVAAALGDALPGPWTLTNARWAQTDLRGGEGGRPPRDAR